MDDFKFIAEIGINHNGNVNLALEMIEAAYGAGCDIVKFQKRTPFLCVPKEQRNKMKYDTPWGDISYLEYKQKIEFGEDEYETIDDFCLDIGIDWTASVWDVNSAHFIEAFDVPYHKIPSAKLTDLELLNTVARFKKHTFISTGMSTLVEIGRAVSIFRSHDCPFELMHSVSVYPMEAELANLRLIKSLRNQFRCNVGYSGHEPGLQISIAAVALGATSVERHITTDRTMWGSDQAASLGITGLRRLVRDCHTVRAAMGDGVKRVLPEEEDKRKSLRG